MAEYKKSGTTKSGRRDRIRRAWPELQWTGVVESAALIFLMLYPLRNIHVGGDLMDTGYNYLNYLYMGTEHVDSMWMFSTFLANLIGHFLTLLPFGETVVGLNFYTAICISLMEMIAYWFCTAKLKIPPVITFAGLFFSINLCWRPTALLYNYLTYLCMLLACIFLYQGIASNRRTFLTLAGMFIGLNVFVRFSNLPELSILLVIWAYGIAAHFEGVKESLLKTLTRTLWFMVGYTGTIVLMLLLLGIAFGPTAYFTGISQLLGMTESASDYKAISMIATLIREYMDAGYWFVRIFFFAVVGVVLSTLADFLDYRFLPRPVGKLKVWPFRKGFTLGALSKLLAIGLACGAIIWLFAGEPERHFTSALYYSYDSMSLPARVLLVILLLTLVIRLVWPSSSALDRMLSLLVLYVLTITPIGSNNGLYAAMNNLFLVLPVAFGELWKFLKMEERDYREVFTDRAKPSVLQRLSLVRLFPVKAVLVAFLLLCAVQFTGFGYTFVFTEATGVQHPDYSVDGVEVLRGLRMSESRAENLSELINFVNENNLKGRETICYGQIPSLALYAGMPPAFNPWPSLRSYSYQRFSMAMSDLSEYPVILLDGKYADYLEGRAVYEPENMSQEGKWALLCEFMKQLGYGETFHCKEFAVYEAGAYRAGK